MAKKDMADSAPDKNNSGIVSMKLSSNRPKKNHFHQLLLVFVLLVVAAGIVVALRDNKPSPQKNFSEAFSIEGKSYSKEDVKGYLTLLVNVQHMSEDQAARQIFEKMKVVRTAEVLKYSPDSQQIERNKKEIMDPYVKGGYQTAQYDKYFTLQATYNTILNSVGSSDPAGLKGYSYVFYFGQHLQYDLDKKPKGADSPSSIEADKAFAKDRAEHYREQLVSNKVKPEDLLKQVKADIKSPDGKVTSEDFSYRFDSSIDKDWKNGVFFAPITDFISKQAKTGLSEIQTGKARATASRQDADMYYYFVYLDSLPKTLNKDTYDKKLSTLSASYKGVN